MRVCVPTMDQNGLDAVIGEHFGRVPFYTFVEPETEEVETIGNTGTHHGEALYPAQIIAKEGADVMLCAGLGRRAVGIFEEEGVHVFIGAEGTVRDALDSYNNGRLQEATDANACQQHAYRRETHDE